MAYADLAFAKEASEAPPASIVHEPITIWSEGVRLKGDIYKPAGLGPGERIPGVLLVHGWGGVKEHLNKAYAPQIARKGFLVLTFDFKSWGESNGPLLYEQDLPIPDESDGVANAPPANVDVTAKQIRRMVNPRSMLADARAALNYLAGEPQVLSDNIGIWGTSLGGGLALVLAAEDDRIKAYVDQIGAVNFKVNLNMITDKMVRAWQVQRARGVIPPYSGAESIINPALKGYPDWIYLKQFDSFASAEKLNVPTLIIDAEDEELFARDLNGGLLHDTIKDRVPNEYLVLPGKHYDIYTGESYQAALKAAQDWFVRHLQDSEQAVALYKQRCANCHSSSLSKAPSLASLKTMGIERIFQSMTDGKMQVHASGLSVQQRQELARYLSKNSVDPRSWEALAMCPEGQRTASIEGISVSGWGYGVGNQRFQSAQRAGLKAGQLNTMEVAWAQGFPGSDTMRSQPIISDDTVFVAVNASSSVYAFDLNSGCLRWSYRSPIRLRSSLGFAEFSSASLENETAGSQTMAALFAGDGRGGVHAINARNGSEIWKASASLSEASTITGTPVPFEDLLYVPISNFEVSKAGVGQYECCREHGGVRAFDIRTGETVWTYETAPTATLQGQSKIGVKKWGPSGAPVWTTPAIDVKRNRLYIGTGENYSWPSTDTSDAIIALDLDSGKEVWKFQALKDDVYTEICVGSYLGYPAQNGCPENSGPDFDFGASVIIAQNSKGQDVLLAGQKSGDVFALNPDKSGELIWQKSLSDGTPVGGIHWGMSLEGDTLFVPIADPEWKITRWDYQPRPGLAALNINTGETRWRVNATRGCEIDSASMDMLNGRQDDPWPECPFAYGYSAAALSIDGAVLAGALNGKLTAFSSKDGTELWSFDSKKSFDALNGVPAHGGALDNGGAAIGNGHLVLQSGYGYFNQMPGNVLLVMKPAVP